MIQGMERLRRWLDDSATTQLSLARALGVSQPTVSDWINGKIAPTVESLRAISAHTGLSIDELLASKNPRRQQQERAGA